MTPVKSNYKVKAFDVVRVMLTHPPLKIILSENIPLDIVYEDDTLLLINKSQEWLFILTWKLYRGL
jgi:23S rRNA pseudouridine1911/1915/1917 synthase